MTLKLHDADDIRAALQGTEHAINAGVPEVTDEQARWIKVGWDASHDAIALSLHAYPWRARRQDEPGT